MPPIMKEALMLISQNKFWKMPIQIERKEVTDKNRKKKSIGKMSVVERWQKN